MKRFSGIVIALMTLSLTLSAFVAPAKAASTRTGAAQSETDFQSRPQLNPAQIEITTNSGDTAPGYVFIAPKKTSGQDGPMIVDNEGHVVWFHPLPEGTDASDFSVQQYEGKPVLTWWQGNVDVGYGQGEYVIADSSYDVIATVKAGNGLHGDLHDFVITPQNTALFTVYNIVNKDLSSVGGPKNGRVLDGIVQEVDIKTGKVLFEWHSLDHVGLDESYKPVPKSTDKSAYDYFHINAVDYTDDGNLLISARHTWTIYKINRKTGDIMWRLGGKKSDFKMGDGTDTAYQHDVRYRGDHTISIFDNGGTPQVHDESRGIVEKLDTDNMTATLLKAYTSPDEILAGTQGNIQLLPNGDVFIGWGQKPRFSEFNSDGDLIFAGKIDDPDADKVDSYRTFRFEWTGVPKSDPAIAVRPNGDGKLTVYASWNGSTEVDSWQVMAGSSPDDLRPIASASKSGFETPIDVSTTAQYISVQALDSSGNVLRSSKVINTGNPASVPSDLPDTGGGGTSQHPGTGALAAIVELREREQ